MNTPIVVLLSHKGSSVYTVPAFATVAEAVREMNQRNVGSVVIKQSGQLTGLLTERDIITRVVAAGRTAENTTVAEVMTRNPIRVHPHATVEEVMAIFTEKRCRHVPVVDDDGLLVGLISIGDVNRWLVEEHRAEADHLRQYIAGSFVM